MQNKSYENKQEIDENSIKLKAKELSILVAKDNSIGENIFEFECTAMTNSKMNTPHSEHLQ